MKIAVLQIIKSKQWFNLTQSPFVYVLFNIIIFSTDAVMPMIPLGLKETKEIDFRDPFKDFILEHYSEDANQYENAIADFMDTRQVTCLSYNKVMHFKNFFLNSSGHENTPT